MLRLPADFFEKRHVGDILSRIGAVQPIQDAITRGVVASIIDGVMALIAAGILLFYSVTLGAIVVFAFTIRSLGLAIAGPLAVFIGAFASPEARVKEAAIFSVILTGACILLFKFFLRLPIPVATFL